MYSTVSDAVGDAVSNQKLDSGNEATNLIHCSEPWQTCCKQGLQFAMHWPFVQCMFGNTGCDLCGQTLSVHFVCCKTEYIINLVRPN